MTLPPQGIRHAGVVALLAKGYLLNPAPSREEYALPVTPLPDLPEYGLIGVVADAPTAKAIVPLQVFKLEPVLVAGLVPEILISIVLPQGALLNPHQYIPAHLTVIAMIYAPEVFVGIV